MAGQLFGFDQTRTVAEQFCDVAMPTGSMKVMNLRDYMKAVVVEQAKKGAKEISRIIDSL